MYALENFAAPMNPMNNNDRLEFVRGTENVSESGAPFELTGFRLFL